MKKIKVTCDKCGKKGIKNIKKHLRYCPGESVTVEMKVKEETTQPLPDSSASTSSEISIEQQPGGILQDKPKEEVKAVVELLQPSVKPPQKPEQRQSNPYVVTYEDMANSVHESLARLVKLATDGQISIKDEDVGRLNRAGAGLLYKYDADGKMLKYSPELVYVGTLIGITTEIILERKERMKAKQAAAK